MMNGSRPHGGPSSFPGRVFQIFSSKSLCQKRNSVLPFAMTLDLYSTQKLQVRKHGYQLDDSSIYLILQRLQRSKYLLLPIYWLQYSVHSLFITMFPFFHTHHIDFSINDQHFENNSTNCQLNHSHNKIVHSAFSQYIYFFLKLVTCAVFDFPASEYLRNDT